MTLQKLTAEALGTALFLIGVVGSGIMAETLTDDIALALLRMPSPRAAYFMF